MGSRILSRLNREEVERLLRLARYLRAPDRDLLAGVLEHGLSVAHIARAAKRCPASLRRRLRTSITLLQSDLFAYVVTCRIRWPILRRRAAELVILERRSRVEAGAEMGVSVHVVRDLVRDVHTLFEVSRFNRSAKRVMRVKQRVHTPDEAIVS